MRYKDDPRRDPPLITNKPRSSPKSKSASKTSTAEEKLKKLRGKIQDIDLLVSDLKWLATDFCLDELVEQRARELAEENSSHPDAYKRVSNPYDWGKDIEKGVFVYFVLCSQVNAVKIGYTSNLKARIGSLQTGNPHRLKMLGWMKGGRTEESTLHRFFAQYHTGVGEWFFFEGDLFDYILSAIKNQPHYLDPKVWLQNHKSQPFNAEPFLSTDVRFLESADTFLEKDRGSALVGKDFAELFGEAPPKALRGS
jgi:hypothetical protein